MSRIREIFFSSHSCSYCEVTPSTTRQISRRCAWWRRSSATWDTTSSRSRSFLWRPPYWWSPTRSVLCDWEKFHEALHSIKVLTACGAVVSISLKCLRVTVQMSRYVRQEFFWQEFLVCGFTDSPPGHISIPCFHGNVLFGWDLAAGKILWVKQHKLHGWTLVVRLSGATSRGQQWGDVSFIGTSVSPSFLGFHKYGDGTFLFLLEGMTNERIKWNKERSVVSQLLNQHVTSFPARPQSFPSWEAVRFLWTLLNGVFICSHAVCSHFLISHHGLGLAAGYSSNLRLCSVKPVEQEHSIIKADLK